MDYVDEDGVDVVGEAVALERGQIRPEIISCEICNNHNHNNHDSAATMSCSLSGWGQGSRVKGRRQVTVGGAIIVTCNSYHLKSTQSQKLKDNPDNIIKSIHFDFDLTCVNRL